jgi:hypothetical protein
VCAAPGPVAVRSESTTDRHPNLSGFKIVAERIGINDDQIMSWTIGLGAIAGVVLIVVVGVLAWVSRERHRQADHGTISPQWINEQRLNDRASHDR